MEMKKISIIVPIYNKEKYLEKCIESIVGQTYKNIEIILIDDGSYDKSPEICDKWAANDERIIVIHKKNGGLPSARNAGLDVCSGDYVMFVDSDDWIDADMAEELYSAAISSKCKVVSSGFYYEFNDGSTTQSNPESLEIHGEDVLFNFLIDNIRPEVCSKMYLRSLISDLRFSERVFYAEDLYYNYFVMKKTDSFYQINKCKYHYSIDAYQSITSHFITDARANHWKMFIEFYNDCKGDKKLSKAAVWRFTFGTFGVLSRVILTPEFCDKYFNEIADAIISLKNKILKNQIVPVRQKLYVCLLSFNKNLFKQLYLAFVKKR